MKPIRSAEQYRLAANTIGNREIDAAKAVLDSGQLTMGEQVCALESEFAAWVGARHAIMVNSGSSANLLLIESLLRGTRAGPYLEPGDEVLVPGLAWPTTVWPIAQLGLVPVFVDVDPSTLAIDLSSAATMLSTRTRAMFLLHALGRAADSAAYARFCADNGLLLIEDCCESLGAMWDGRHVGAGSVGASFSFYFSHHISTVEGGMVITDDAHLADDLRSFRAHGWIRGRADASEQVAAHPEFDPRFLFLTTGYNVRATEIQAAIGRVQLDRLDEMLGARDALARSVNDWLKPTPWLTMIGAEVLDEPAPASRSERRHSWMTLPMRVDPHHGVDRDATMRHLESNGVETRPVIAGNLARHPAIRQVPHRAPAQLPVCDELLRNSFMIGCHPSASPASLHTLEKAICSLADL